MPMYRVIVLSPAGEPETEEAGKFSSAEAAVHSVTGEELTRGLKGQQTWLRAKVYRVDTNPVSLIRFYAQSSESQRPN